ncbi:MAG: cytochrome c [Myxococcota bacterium]|nr:cytochrome c [Myxococcota bacterium]
MTCLVLLWAGCHSERATVSPTQALAQDAPPTESSNIAPPRSTQSTPRGRDVLARIDLAAALTNPELAKLKPRTINLPTDPFYRSGPVALRGISFERLLSSLPLMKDLDRSTHALRFVCSDGYKTTFPFSAIEGGDGIVATTMMQGDQAIGWPKRKRGKGEEDAGPYYLVWANEKYDEKRPWPYQWTALEIITTRGLHARLKPPEHAKVDAGHALYITHCKSCHSVNLVGGRLGPELNVPQNITTYRPRSQLVAFMKHPQAFRAGSLMPPSHLDDKQLNQVLDYLEAMATVQVCQTADACTQYLGSAP